jgi:hypothetical protein
MLAMKPTLERLLAKTAFELHPDPTLGFCWLWTGSVDGKGYGQIRRGRRSEGLARTHRIGYELLVGPIPDGHEPDHRCRRHRCWNPEHLEPITHRENVLRGESPQARNARKTHCPQGHPYDATNTYFMPDGSRRCRACNRERARRVTQARRRAASPS